MKLYAVYPVDGVTFRSLVELYKVKPAECVDMSRREDILGRDLSKLIPLRVRFDGNYITPKRCQCGGIDTDGDGDCSQCKPLSKEAKP